jgi:hypothetical protein
LLLVPFGIERWIKPDSGAPSPAAAGLVRMLDRDPRELELGHDASRKLDTRVPQRCIADRRSVGFTQEPKDQGLLALADESIDPRSTFAALFTREEPDAQLANLSSGGLSDPIMSYVYPRLA